MTPVRHLHRSSTGPERPGRSRGERGESLIEILGTIVLLGFGFVFLLQGIFTVAAVSDSNQQRTRASITAQAYVESLIQPVSIPEAPSTTSATAVDQIDFTTYIPCAIPGTYGGPPGGALPAGYTATVTKVRYLMGYDASLNPKWSSNVGDCYATWEWNHNLAVRGSTGVTQYYTRDKGLQEITVRIDSGARTRGQVADTLTFIKRDQRCPGTFDNADTGPC